MNFTKSKHKTNKMMLITVIQLCLFHLAVQRAGCRPVHQVSSRRERSKGFVMWFLWSTGPFKGRLVLALRLRSSQAALFRICAVCRRGLAMTSLAKTLYKLEIQRRQCAGQSAVRQLKEPGTFSGKDYGFRRQDGDKIVGKVSFDDVPGNLMSDLFIDRFCKGKEI